MLEKVNLSRVPIQVPSMMDRYQILMSVNQTRLQLSRYSWTEAIMGSMECTVNIVNVEDHANVCAACFLLQPVEAE